MKTWIIIALALLILINFLYFLALFYYFILQPSFYSVVVNCVPSGEAIANSNGYYIDGLFLVSTTNETLVQNPQNLTKVLKHELCHKNQFEKNRLHSCKNQVSFYFDEVECYIRQYF